MLTDEQVKANVAANVPRLLVERRMTQKQLAERTGDPQMTISAMCRGLYVPGAGLITRVAEALDVSTDRLTGSPPEFSRRAS